ncbi:DUF4390 domain-containing protein [bacterium]|nr:DUF4390 domain-containing protein [bacterium]
MVILGIFLSVPYSALEASDREKPRIKRFRVFQKADFFFVTGTLFPAFQSDIEASILAGIPTTFRFEIFLKNPRWYWANEILAHAAYLHTVTYDTLRKTYTVTVIREGEAGIILSEETSSRQKMQELMTRFHGDLHFSRFKLFKDKEYYVSLTATLTTRQLPFPWDKLLFFLTSDFNTETSRKFFSKQD